MEVKVRVQDGFEPVIPRPNYSHSNIGERIIGVELHWTSEYSMLIREMNEQVEINHNYTGQNDVEDDVQVFQHHYTVRTHQQLLLPAGFDALILPLPRFFLGDPKAPSVLSAVVEADWCPMTVTVACRRPRGSWGHFFEAGRPFCQVVPIPRERPTLVDMTPDEKRLWSERESVMRQAPTAACAGALIVMPKRICWDGTRPAAIEPVEAPLIG